MLQFSIVCHLKVLSYPLTDPYNGMEYKGKPLHTEHSNIPLQCFTKLPNQTNLRISAIFKLNKPVC